MLILIIIKNNTLEDIDKKQWIPQIQHTCENFNKKQFVVL